MCKAYDRVNWNFLKVVMLGMNFSNTWVNWIMECVIIVKYTLLINGIPTQTIHPTRGNKQRDPSSPYLFLLWANILSIALTQAENIRLIKGISIGRQDVSFTHPFFFFANDSLFFFQKDKSSLTSLRKIILWYCSISG